MNRSLRMEKKQGHIQGENNHRNNKGRFRNKKGYKI